MVWHWYHFSVITTNQQPFFFLRKCLWSWISILEKEDRFKTNGQKDLNLLSVSRVTQISPEPEVGDAGMGARMALFLGKGKYSLDKGISN